VRLSAVWTHCVQIGPERRPSQTSPAIRGLHFKQEPYRSGPLRTELGDPQLPGLSFRVLLKLSKH